jgi:hypothetical protein
MQIKNVKKNFQTIKEPKISTANLYQSGVKESNGDVSSGQTRLLAAEIVISLFSATGKVLITSKWHKMENVAGTRTGNHGRYVNCYITSGFR